MIEIELAIIIAAIGVAYPIIKDMVLITVRLKKGRGKHRK